MPNQAPQDDAPSLFPPSAAPALRWIYRHTGAVRAAHWINAVCLPILILSGLQIFNAHPALYWGERSDRDRPLLALTAESSDAGLRGITVIFGRRFDTTRLLGASAGPDGKLQRRGFPAWATLPSQQWLAMGRRWHLFFAWVFALNGAAFAFYGLASRHLTRDLVPTAAELRAIGPSIVAHLQLQHPTGDAATRYNVLQKLAYAAVILGLGPLIVWTGLAMSPRMDAAFPFLTGVLGGRQSARAAHFIACFAFIGFIAVHLLMVLITGVWNNIRSMVTGYYRVPRGES